MTGMTIQKIRQLKAENARQKIEIENGIRGYARIEKENAELRKKLAFSNGAVEQINREYDELKSRWEKLEQWKDRNKIETNLLDTAFMNGQAVVWNHLVRKMSELSSSCESIKPVCPRCWSAGRISKDCPVCHGSGEKKGAMA